MSGSPILTRTQFVIARREATWAFFGDVPRCPVIDNFPTTAPAPDPEHPRLTAGLLGCFQHRGFGVDAARVRHRLVERSVSN